MEVDLGVGTVELHGPMFNGRAAGLSIIATEQVRMSLAEEGEKLVRQNFEAQIQVNRGIFLATITTIDATALFQWAGTWTRDGASRSRVYSMPVVVDDPTTEVVVTTKNAMYGPWLEGTGSRNFTTRFKGYHGFRMATQQLADEAEGIAERVIAPYVRMMNE